MDKESGDGADSGKTPDGFSALDAAGLFNGKLLSCYLSRIKC